MNTFAITRALDKDMQPVAPHPVVMVLNKEAAADPNGFGGFLAHFEIEILQGSITELPNNQVEYRFELDDEKGELFKQALTLAYFQLQQSQN